MTLDIDLTIPAPIALHAQFSIRGFTALLGRSGAGKSTLLRALAGLIPASGTPFAGVPAEARRVGYLPQGAALFPHLTALQNAAFALRGPARLIQAQSLLDGLGVGALAAQNAASLSGGEAQRVALARALASNPLLLLLDEPSAALDAPARDRVIGELISEIGKRGIPALASTHDAAMAGMADWLVVLADGQIAQQGVPRDLFDHPATRDVAALVGFTNFIPGQVIGRDEAGLIIQAGGVVLRVSGHYDYPPGAQLLLTIRADDLTLDGSMQNLLSGIVTSVLQHGSFVRLTIRSTSGIDLDMLVTYRTGGARKTGEHVTTHLPPDRIRIVA